jgi:hypothetical protein
MQEEGCAAAAAVLGKMTSLTDVAFGCRPSPLLYKLYLFSY